MQIFIHHIDSLIQRY